MVGEAKILEEKRWGFHRNELHDFSYGVCDFFLIYERSALIGWLFAQPYTTESFAQVPWLYLIELFRFGRLDCSHVT